MLLSSALMDGIIGVFTYIHQGLLLISVSALWFVHVAVCVGLNQEKACNLCAS